jgi:hypothetical protein
MCNDTQKMENEYHCLGCIGSAEVGVQPTLTGQEILIQHSDLGQRLACLLATGKAEVVRREDVLYWRIPHDREVDKLLMQLTDLFITIRYAHPTLVQLELVLPDLDALMAQDDDVDKRSGAEEASEHEFDKSDS